jgi:hypothetical protein
MSQASPVITAIPAARREPAPSRPQRQQKRRAIKALRRQSGAAIAIGGVGVTLVTVSLNHLAHGIELVTSTPAWEAWTMAVGIDLGFVALETSQLATMGEKVRRHIARWARAAIIGTVIGSAAMNAFAFAAHTTTVWMTSAAVTLGIAIPALVYALMRVGAALYIDCHSKA